MVDFIENPTSVTENVLNVTSGSTEYTIQNSGWYRIIIKCTSASGGSSFRINNKAALYLAEKGEYQTLLPLKHGTVVKGSIELGTGAVIMNYLVGA